MKVRDLMTTHPVAVLPSDSIVTVARAMREGDVGLIPVVESIEDMRLLGVITDRDIATRCVANGHADACAVAEHMTSPPLHTVKPTDDVEKAMGMMQWARVRRIPVVEENGKLVGIVSQADVATNAQAQELRLIERTLAAISTPRRRITSDHIVGFR